MKIRNFKYSDQYRAKVHDLIPGGAHTYSKGDDQFPLLSPAAISYGKGGYLFDIDDNKFLDLASTGEADYLITGDQDLLSLDVYQNTRIIQPALFLRIILPEINN